MPKRPPRNAFFFFMVDFREEQRKNGIVYHDMAEVSEAAGPLWKDAPTAVRQKYQDMAKKEKEKSSASREKFTSMGVSISELDRRERELKEAENRERREIRQLVQSAVLNESITTEIYFVIDVNYYCHASYEYVIAEFSVACFNVKDGIVGEYHQIVNPGDIPVGYGSDAKMACQELGFEMPNETTRRSNYAKLLANLIEFINPQFQAGHPLPPLYTMPDKLAPVHSFILQMCQRAGEDDSQFRIYKIDTLFYQLINGLKGPHEDGFPKESIARIQLVKDLFQFSSGIACEFHHEIDKASACSLSRAKRWIFTILDHCCPLADVTMCAGKHVPPDFDMKKIQVYNDERRKAATLENFKANGSTPSAPDQSSLVNCFAKTTLNSPSPGRSGDVKHERVHQPLRMPKTEFAKQLRPAPELQEDQPMYKYFGRGEADPPLNKPYETPKFDA